MELLGYSERGLISAFFYGAKAKSNPVEIIGEFLKCLRDSNDHKIFESTNDPSEILVLIEPCLGKGAGFGDPDFIIRFRLDQKGYLIYFQVKIENYRQSRGRKNSSSISNQLILSDKFGARFAEISAEDLSRNGIAAEKKKLKDRFVVRRILIERLWDYRAGYFSGCVTADPVNPLTASDHPVRSCWMGLHDLYRIAEEFEITGYTAAADFNKDKKVFSDPVDLRHLRSETMRPAARESYDTLEGSIKKFISENDKALRLSLNKRSLSIKCRRCSGKVLLTLTPRVNTLTGYVQFRRAYRESVCPHGSERLIRDFLGSLEGDISFEL